MERLVAELSSSGHTAHVSCAFSPEEWRERMAAGRFGRLRARVSSMVHFPLQAVQGLVKTAPGTIAITTTNPFYLPALALGTRFVHGRQVVGLVYDLYPEAARAAGLRGLGIFDLVARALNKYWLQRVDGVVFIGTKMANAVIATYGEPRKWTVIETGASSRELSAAPAAPFTHPLRQWCQGRTIISYVGNMGLVHDWETMATGIPKLLDQLAAQRVGVVIAASGPGVDRLRSAWAHLPPDVIRFESPLDDNTWAWLLKHSHISLVSLKGSASRTSIPSKTFSAMAAGSAVLAVTPRDSDLADLMVRHRCGAIVEPSDVEGFVATVGTWLSNHTLLDDLGRRGQQAVLSEYDMPALRKRWLEFCANLPSGRTPHYSSIKRTGDVAASLLALVALAPILGLAAAAIGLTMGRPILFRQERPGLHGAPFRLLKFRTMRHPRPGEDGPESDGERLTRLGRFLRRTSIDELPTLWNVLRGDMSLVGPRPLLMRYLSRYTPDQARRHQVPPGVTGWAQINGRNQLSWTKKFELDSWYVDHRATWLDLHILLRTVIKVLQRDGISQSGHPTMAEFLGNEEPELGEAREA